MLKIKKENSVILSLILAYAALPMIAAICVILPGVVDRFMESENVLPLTVGIYTAIVPVLVADIMLIRLLMLVRKNEVFTSTSVALLRGISWCCFAECTVMVVIAVAVLPRLNVIVALAGFAAAFLGLVLRVVKNVIEQATVIKSENDLTV